MYSDLSSLTVGLPEDIAKLKWFGDFERAKKVIHMRLKKDLPEMLRKRLELELRILDRIPAQYPYTTEEALKILKNNIRDFREEELEELRDEDAAEWIYINGEVHFKNDFLANLVKTRKYLADRVLNPKLTEMKLKNFELLDETIAKMKAKGSLAYHFRIRSSIRIKPEAERIGETIKVHLPVPLEYAQVKNFKLLRVSDGFQMIASPDYPQRTVYFETKLSAGQEFTVEYEFENHMNYVDPSPEKVLDAQPTFCTEEQLPHIKFTPYMRSLVKEVVKDETNPLIKARKIYDYITTHVMYSFVRSYFTITDLPEYMATGFKGDCGIQALLFITMCRCAGIPARWQAGLYSTPLDIGNHDWAQFYIAPYGWLFADCSFGGAAYREGSLDRWNFYFGNLEPFRIPANSDFQHEFNPPKKYLRNDPYDNQSGEAEYEDFSLEHEMYDSKHEILEIKEV
ncbi:MAG: transglutaminase-like domain-containing protein [Enterocloster sp.]